MTVSKHIDDGADHDISTKIIKNEIIWNENSLTLHMQNSDANYSTSWTSYLELDKQRKWIDELDIGKACSLWMSWLFSVQTSWESGRGKFLCLLYEKLCGRGELLLNVVFHILVVWGNSCLTFFKTCFFLSCWDIRCFNFSLKVQHKKF